MGKKHTQKKRRIKNPVARVMNEFNKPATHRDKTKYKRKDKYNGKKGSQDPFLLARLFKWFLCCGCCGFVFVSFSRT